MSYSAGVTSVTPADAITALRAASMPGGQASAFDHLVDVVEKILTEAKDDVLGAEATLLNVSIFGHRYEGPGSATPNLTISIHTQGVLTGGSPLPVETPVDAAVSDATVTP